ncbi:MAG TPA: DUF58 domain-containing protein [Pirellulales bacterium]|jgi:uncharacterized protein (DUF58 family)|nr:DUF58 domain-containing protein [Pirellulales bacterium]
MELFDSAFLQRLEYLSLVSRRVFRGALLAQRRTMQAGGGIEFADHRPYTVGDDLRYLDWSVYARHEQLLLKRFQEEEDLHVYLLLDCSRSMEFGSPRKFDLARQVAAALAYIALADLDRVSVTAFAGEIVADFPLTRGKNRILSLLKFLESLEPQPGETDLARAAGSFVHRTQRRGLAVVISDMFDPRGYERGLDLLRHRRYEPHLVQIFDPSEAEPSYLGDLELIDVENSDVRQVTVTERALRTYRRLFDDFQTSLARYCRNYGLSCTQSTTHVPFDELILGMMNARALAT